MGASFNLAEGDSTVRSTLSTKTTARGWRSGTDGDGNSYWARRFGAMRMNMADCGF